MSFLDALRKLGEKKKSFSSQRELILHSDQLERRRLLTTAKYTVHDLDKDGVGDYHVLTVTGSSIGDNIWVNDAGGKVKVNDGAVAIQGAPAGGLNSAVLNAIKVDGKGGSDTIDMGEVEAADFTALGVTPSAADPTPVDVFGGLGNDDITGSIDFGNHLNGGSGHDGLLGGDQDDYIDGGGGNDDLIGLNGDDTLIGGTGADYLLGGEGVDDLNAGGDPGDEEHQ